MRCCWLVIGGLWGCSFPSTSAISPDADPNAPDARRDDEIDARPGARDAREDVDAAVLGPWGSPQLVVFVAMPVAVGFTADDPTLTDDELELYFNYTRSSAGISDIWVSKRNDRNAAWGAPAAVTVLNTTSVETTPEVSGDGLHLYFGSDRGGGPGGNGDVWRSTRQSRTDAWNTPMLVASLNTTFLEGGGGVTDDGLAIVFSSSRSSDGGATPDIFLATRPDSGQAFGTPVELTSINDHALHDGSPFISEDRRTVYFDSTRNSAHDLMAATRTSTTASFSAPTPIVELSSLFRDEDAWVSDDGRHIVFASNRSGSDAIWEAFR